MCKGRKNAADDQISPYDTFHDAQTKRPGDCIERLHDDRQRRTIGQIVPDLVTGAMFKECDAEGFVVANFILARSGMTGQANNDTIPLYVLKKLAAAFLTCPVKVSYQEMLWTFGAQTFSTNEVINGTELGSWKLLLSHKRFLKSWSPTTPTKAGQSSFSLLIIRCR